MRHSENRNSDFHSSPKRFLKTLTSLPLRQYLKSPLQLAPNGHSRSLSHEAFQLKNVQTSLEWTNLIPPLPAASSNHLNLSSSLSANELGLPPQRHSIAISPISSKNIPDMLQPLPDPSKEKEFEFPKFPALNSRTSSLGLLMENRNPFRKQEKEQIAKSDRLKQTNAQPFQASQLRPQQKALDQQGPQQPHPVHPLPIRHPQTHPQVHKPGHGSLLPFNPPIQRPMSEEFNFSPTPPPQRQPLSKSSQPESHKATKGITQPQSRPPKFQPPGTPSAPLRQVTPNSQTLSISSTQPLIPVPDGSSLSLTRKELLRLQLQRTLSLIHI